MKMKNDFVATTVMNLCAVVKGVMARTWLVVFAASLVHLACVKTEKPTIMLDMSKEHDELRFFPEKGDQVGIKLYADAKVQKEFAMTDENKDWVYQIEIRDVVKDLKVDSDTLNFRFYLVAGDSRYLPNNGEELIHERKMSINDLHAKKPVFIFNEPYEDLLKATVTFSVGISCQKVLGFFRPEDGDQVIVSGSFSAWNEKGILMEDKDNDNVYTVEAPVKYRPGTAIEYKFRIVNSRNAILPQDGWENRDNRMFTIQNEKEELPYAEFSDVRRVARFIIDVEKIEKNGKYLEKKGDVLQIRLFLDQNEILTDPLMKVNTHTYETAVIIPLTVQKIKWQLMKNIKEDLTQVKEEEVDLNGKIIEMGI